MPSTEQEEIYLRPLLENDLQHMEDWDQDAEIGYFFGFDEDSSGLTYRERCLALMGQSNHRLWAIESKRYGFIGEVELTQISWRLREAELKVCIGDPNHRGLGFGTQAIKLTLEVAFTRLKLDKIYLRVYQYNTRAIRCYLGIGFKKEAVLKNRHRFGGANRDIYLMYIDQCAFRKRHCTNLKPSIDKELASSL